MYEMLKAYINRGDYKLTEMSLKIKQLWVTGDLNYEQKEELLNMAQVGAQVSGEVDLVAKLAELERRVSVLEKGTQTTPNTEYPEYIAGKWYYAGDGITFDGTTYTCVAPEGQVCVWSPLEYPTYWARVAE